MERVVAASLLVAVAWISVLVSTLSIWVMASGGPLLDISYRVLEWPEYREIADSIGVGFGGHAIVEVAVEVRNLGLRPIAYTGSLWCYYPMGEGSLPLARVSLEALRGSVLKGVECSEAEAQGTLYPLQSKTFKFYVVVSRPFEGVIEAEVGVCDWPSMKECEVIKAAAPISVEGGFLNGLASSPGSK